MEVQFKHLFCKILKKLLLISAFLSVVSCQKHQPEITYKELKKVYQEFNKIIIPKSVILPLANKEESLILMKFPLDLYSKIYVINNSSGSLRLKLDAGRNIVSITCDPKRKHFYLLMDDYGNELYSIYAYDINSDKYEKLFGYPDSAAYIADFSMDGEKAFIFSNHETKRGFFLYALNVKTGKIKKLTKSNINYRGADVTRDERFASLTKFNGNDENALYLLDLKNSKEKLLLHKPGTLYIHGFFHPSKPYLFVNTNHDSDRFGCAKINYLDPKGIEWVFRANDRDISCYFDDIENYSFRVESYRGKRKIRVYEGLFEREIPLPIPRNSYPSQFSVIPGTKKLLFMLSRAQSPPEYFTADLENPTHIKRISSFNRSRFDKKDFGSSQDIIYRGFDGLELHAILFAKSGWSKANEKHPAVIWVHGGPDSSVRHQFHPFIAFLTLNGYAVLAPNFRGSSGYGRKFERLNDRDWAGGDLKDLMFAKKELLKLRFTDPGRIYILGTSFGGYLSLMAVAKYPGEFAAASSIMPMTNLLTFFRNMPGDPERIQEYVKEIGHPVYDETLLVERSPYFHTDKIKTPLLILYAQNDTRINKQEAMDFAGRMKSNSTPFKSIELKGEGHSLGKSESWETIFLESLAFFEKYH